VSVTMTVIAIVGLLINLTYYPVQNEVH